MGVLNILMGMLFTVLPLLSVIGLWIASLYNEKFANVVYKLHLLRVGLANMLFSTDKRWSKSKQPDAEEIEEIEESKQIIFVRHGESKWNLVFNKGFNSSFPGRLFNALAEEFSEITTLDSVFVDSPLSEEGCDQAKGLAKFIEGNTDEGIGAIVKGIGEGDSVIVSSNLRRALSTTTIAFWDRLQRTQEKILILSSLQEITFNIDGVALAKAQGYPELAHEELHAVEMTKETFVPERIYNALENDGDKPVNSVGISRIREFCAWCFERDEQTIIVGGHSLYFRFFFETFLPKSSTHIAKKQKLANCAVVSFTLHKGKLRNGKVGYKIEENSIEPLYIGFEDKKTKKKSKKD